MTSRAKAAVFVGVVTAAVFSRGVLNGFVSWDDGFMLVRNPYFRGLDPARVRWMFWNFTASKYQPLSWLTFGLDYLLWGMDPAGYHLTSLLWHAAASAVFCLLAFRVLKSSGAGSNDRTRLLGAVFAALFFAIHPLRVESASWAANRGDPVSAFFYLLSLLLYIEERLAASLICFILSLSAKATGITLPAVLLLLDVYPLGRRPSVKLVKEKLPFLLVALVFALVGLKGQSTARALVPMARFGLLERVEQSFYGPVFYLAKTLWPFELSPLYVLSPRLQPAPFVLSAIFVAALTAAVVARRRRWPWALAAWVYYLLALLPVIGLVKLGLAIASDRYSYLPALAPALLFGAAAASVSARRRLVATAVLAGLSILTISQIGYWHDSTTFWSRAIEVDPDCYVCHKNLSDALLMQGREKEAGEHLWLSSLLLAKARHELGEWYYNAGRYEEARLRFTEALEALPNVPETENNLGLTLARLGRLSEAVDHFNRALKVKPDFAGAARNRDAVLVALRQTTNAR